MPSNQYYRFPQQSSPYAWELPDDRYLRDPNQMAPPQQGMVDVNVPPPAPPGSLADVEGVTNAYYDTFGKLKGYAEAMAKKGIDVTQPDLSQPGGGVAFQTFQRLSGAQMTIANQLGNKLKEDTEMRPYMATGATIKNKEGKYIPTKFLPEVELLAKQLSQQFYTGPDADRALDTLKPLTLATLKSHYDVNDPYIQDQIRIVEGLGTSYTTHPYLFQQHYERARQKEAAGATREVADVRRTAAIKNGMWGEKEHDVVDGSDGKSYALSNAWNGKVIDAVNKDGKRINAIIKNISQDQDGKVVLNFEPDTETGDVLPPERIDNQNAADLHGRLQQFNRGMGSYDKMMGAIQTLGIGDEAYGFHDETGLADNLDQLNANKTSISGKIKKKGEIRKAKAVLDKRFNNGEEINLTLPGGRSLIVKKRKGGVFNLNALNGYDVKENGNNSVKSEAELQQLLDDSGYFDSTKAPQQTDAQMKAADYINKYGKK